MDRGDKRAQAARGRKSVQAWHLDIKQHAFRGRRQVRQQCQGSLAAGRFADYLQLGAAREPTSGQVEKVTLIVDEDEGAAMGGRLCHAVLSARTEKRLSRR
jgi:hypothetical protein